MTPVEAPPSQQQASLGNNECDAKRIFLILEMTCLTPDAYRSFKVSFEESPKCLPYTYVKLPLLLR